MKQQRDHSNEQDDATLVARVLAGERDIFDILLQRYTSSVQRLCTRLLGNSVEVQDIVQEASLQAFLGLSRLREPARFAAWFHAIAANLARSALRRRHECSWQQITEDAMTEMVWIVAPRTLEEYQMEREIHEAILLALQDLSLVNRQAVIGFYLQGYSYEELSQLLGVPISTVKWRLFQGRKLLKTLLRPLAETFLHPLGKQRKEQNMATSTLIELQIDSMCTLSITRQQVAILCDSEHQERGIPVRLTTAEADALGLALEIRKSQDPFPFLQDFSQRLLESFNAQLQRVVINTLAGQTLYATITIKQGAQTREIDLRLSEALALAARLRVSLFMTPSLFETAATLDLTVPVSFPSAQDIEARAKNMQNLGREERLQLEEDVQGRMVVSMHDRPEKFSTRLGAFLLESLTGGHNVVSAAALSTLDIAAAFPTHEVTWDEQPLVAICLSDQPEQPDQLETAWLLVRPSLWRRLTHPKWSRVVRELEHSEEPIPFVDGLPPQIQQQVEACLAHLADFPQIRAALLLYPQGTLAAWKGPDTQEIMQRFSRKVFEEFSLHRSLDHQLGPQPRSRHLARYDTKRQEIPESFGGQMVGYMQGGWIVVILFTENAVLSPNDEIHSRIRQAKQELSDILMKPILG